MSLKTYIVASLPPPFVRWLGQLQFRYPMLGPLIRGLGRAATSGVQTIQHGVGAGLKIDNTLGHPGHALGTTEPEEQAALAKLIEPGAVVWNIGANIGFLALLIAKLAGEDGLVLAVEPTPATAEAARKNARLNGFDHLLVIQKAVSDADGEVTFHVDDNGTTNSLIHDNHRPSRPIRVEAVTLDTFARSQTRPPTLVTIDVEGAEARVLLGALEALRIHRPDLLLENHWRQREISAIFDEHLQPLGYRWLELDFTHYAPKDDAVREHSIFTCRPGNETALQPKAMSP